MKLKSILLGLTIAGVLLGSCEESKDSITPLNNETIIEENIVGNENTAKNKNLTENNTEKVTENEFLPYKDQQLLINILEDNSIENYWEIESLKKGDEDFGSRFKGVKFVFEKTTVSIDEITLPQSNITLPTSTNTIISGNTFEPGNTNVQSPDIKPYSDFYESLDGDLLMTFVMLTPRNKNINDVEKYDLIRNLLTGDQGENLMGIDTKKGLKVRSYKVLKGITSNRVVLKFDHSEERFIILKKK